MAASLPDRHLPLSPAVFHLLLALAEGDRQIQTALTLFPRAEELLAGFRPGS